jgi:CcmD family protein
MHKKIYALSLILAVMLTALISRAQGGVDSDRVEMADTLRSNGKIYIVVAVVVTILLGLLLYLIRLDRKIGRMEKK